MKRKPGCMTHLWDFANTLKAFIGSNYLGIAYAFNQSGLIFGIIGLVIIAVLTDHCCHLLVKSKYHATKQILSEHKQKKKRFAPGNRIDCTDYSFSSSSSDDENSAYSTADPEVEFDEISMLEQHMYRHMTYGDVGRVSFGKTGLIIVNIFIGVTQFCFCVSYFIFIGNTIHGLFPPPDCHNSSLYAPVSTASAEFYNYTWNNIQNQSLEINDTLESSNLVHEVTTEHDGPVYNYNATTSGPIVSSPFQDLCTEIAPSLLILVAAPLPIFIIFALIRTIRKMGWISVLANICILGGCVAVFIYIFVGFKVNKDFHWGNIDGIPIFFGMVTSSYEGIGLIIPVESSMDGNRHNFNSFLHGAVLMVTFILGTFGILGYVRFADGVKQMINLNITHGTFVFYTVNIGVCIGVLLTFPLQIYPVIELIEIILFSKGRICGPKTEKEVLLREDIDSTDSLLPHETKKLPIGVAISIPDSVPAWKRNIVRMLVVCTACGVAIIFRNSFAYIGAFTGAIGSSALAYILPCLFHFWICRRTSTTINKLKDVIIMIFGLVSSAISLYYVLLNLIRNTSV